MDTRRVKTVFQAIGLLALGIFIFTSTFSLAVHSSSMEMDQDGNMLGCFLMGETAMCQINAFEHLSLWQNTFTTTLSISASAALLLALAWFIVSHRARYRVPAQVLTQPFSSFHEPEIALVDYLRLAFSQGILHPKIY